MAREFPVDAVIPRNYAIAEDGLGVVITNLKPCMSCGGPASVFVETEGAIRFLLENAPVIVAFPYLDADDREKLISGIHPNCWNAIFGEDD